jgi:hypothetical protein
MKKLSAVLLALIAIAVGIFFSGMDQGEGDKPFVPRVAAPPPPAAMHSDLGDGDPQPGVSVGAGLLPRIASAGPSQAGCTTKLISHNFSTRSSSPSMFVLHYTVSRNRDGLSDVDGIRNFFDNPAAEVSSHYVIDWEGNCYLIVPESMKAWTQGAFNSDAISIEFIAFGDEPQADWASKGDAGLRRGARVVADSIRRNGIPFRYVDPSGCTAKPGITDHNKLECGNDHTDVEPNFPWKKFKRYVAAAMEPPKDCVRLSLTNGGEVLNRSAIFKPNEYRAALKRFEETRRDKMVGILKGGDGSYGIARVKVAC